MPSTTRVPYTEKISLNYYNTRIYTNAGTKKMYLLYYYT